MNTEKIFTIIILAIVVIVARPLVANAIATCKRKDSLLKGTSVWIIQPTIGYETSTSLTKKVVIAKGRKAYAQKEKNSRLLIECDSKKFWIDTRDILINVKQYIPGVEVRLELARHNNRLNMGNEKISNISNRRYYHSKGAINNTECWVRYEVAKRLCKAQEEFGKLKYGIVVYDAYRPYFVTTQIRNEFNSFLEQREKLWKKYWFDKFEPDSFISQYASAHNYGYAVDIALKDMSTGKLLSMPTKIYTLDKRASYSCWANEKSTSSRNARYMKSVMERHNFVSNEFEWWDFQIDDVNYGNIIDLAI